MTGGNTVTRTHRKEHGGVRHPVLDVIRARVAAGSVPGGRDDDFRVALAVEGGSMRSVVTSGMTAALERLGYANAFDEVYGSSAGAAIGGYFLAGQAAFGTTVFSDTLTDGRFFSWRRSIRGEPPMSLDYLIDDVMERQRPLRYDRILDSPTSFHVVATNIDAHEPQIVPDTTTKAGLRRAFRAAILQPVIAGDPIEIAGSRWCDAGLFISVPFRLAIGRGATHTLVLQSRPLGNPRGAQGRIERTVARRYFGRVAPRLLEPYLSRVQRYNDDMQFLRRACGEARAPFAFGVAPAEGTACVSQWERGRPALLAGAESGFRAVYAALAGSAPGAGELLTA